jgi:DNA-binding NarL/FixJ family response regulator
MKSQEIIHIAVAETSMIVRSGLVAVLKRLPDLNVQTVEITSKEGLQSECTMDTLERRKKTE